MNSRVIVLSVKLLEQQTKSVSLPHNSTVLELKQKIKVVFDIDGERQRLIFRGKVLRDDKKLLDYDNLDDGKVIHLVVRPSNNDFSSRSNNNRIRASAREISDDYAVITVDATLDTLEDARMLMQNILNNLTPGNPPSILEQRQQVSLSHEANRTLRANANRATERLAREHMRTHLDAASSNLMDTLRPMPLPVPTSLELSLSSLLAFMSDLRAMIHAPPGPYRRRNSSFGRVLQESRQRLRNVGERQANQVGLVMDEVADLMVLLIPQVTSVSRSLRTENNRQESSEEQLANVLRVATMVQFLSSTFHFLASILSTAQPEVIHSPPPSNNTTVENNTATTPESSSSTTTTTTQSQTKRKLSEDQSSSSSSSSKRQQRD
ncbi:unnamed protein product [Mucor hiemalis]